MTRAALYCLFAVLSRFDQRFAPTLTLNKQYPGDASQCQRQHLKGHLPDAADSSLAGPAIETGGTLCISGFPCFALRRRIKAHCYLQYYLYLISPMLYNSFTY